MTIGAGAEGDPIESCADLLPDRTHRKGPWLEQQSRPCLECVAELLR